MNRINLHRVLWFLFVLVTVTILIYSGQSYLDKQKATKIAQDEARLAQQQQKAEKDADEARRKAEHDRAELKRKEEEQLAKKTARIAERQREADRAREHLQFVNQYVSTNFSRTPGLPLVAVAVAAENKTMNHAMSAALIRRFKGEHAQLVDSFFKPPLVSDDLFNDAFNGSSALFNRLDITNSLDALLLARQDVQYSTNTELNNIITANMRLEMVTLPMAGRLESQGWTFTANGTGFRPAEARMQAEERILKQISDKPNMALGLIGSKN